MTKVLVTGASGQLGYELQQEKPNGVSLVALTRAELDLSDTGSISRVLKHHAPDVVINAAAYTAVDKAESEEDVANQINGDAVGVIAQACNEMDIPLLHISTDFVFDGTKTAPYDADDATNPLSVYGASKLLGEARACAAHDKTLIIRTSWVYSTHGNNFVKTMLRLMAERDELGIIADQVGTPTYAKGLAALLYTLIDQSKLDYGIYHYSDLGTASWYDFACAIKRIALEKGFDINPKCQVNPIATTQYPTPATRPAFSVMNKAPLMAEYRQQFEHWEDRLIQMLDTLKSA